MKGTLGNGVNQEARSMLLYQVTNCDMDVATDRRAAWPEIRKADRSRASGPPSPGEHTDV
jgi:hypothetical protein